MAWHKEHALCADSTAVSLLNSTTSQHSQDGNCNASTGRGLGAFEAKCPMFLIDNTLPCRLLSLADSLQRNAPPQQHLAAEGALNLALRLGIAPHVVMDRLLGASKDASFYEAYRPVIHTWLIFNAASCNGKLLEALAGSYGSPQHAQRAQRTAGLILNGCLESLQRSRDAQAGRADIRQRCVSVSVLPWLTHATLDAVSGLHWQEGNNLSC